MPNRIAFEVRIPERTVTVLALNEIDARCHAEQMSALLNRAEFNAWDAWEKPDSLPRCAACGEYHAEVPR